MRASEFQRAIEDEFGPGYADTVARDVILGALGDRSAREALADGVPPRTVWLELCEAMGVPESRRHGAGLADPPRRR